jgi:hypothetical protein
MGFLCASAQNQQSWESLFHDMGIFDDTEQEMQASTFEVLNELAEHKVNLHSATQEDLEQIPFLSDEQIEEICEYQYRYGPMRSIGELALIESLSYEQRKLLSFFVEIRDTSPKGFPSMKDILKYGKNELMGNIHIPFYEREGDKDGYLGYPYKHSFRYSFQYGEYVKAGIIGAQDAGEPFLSNKNKWGYDYYSFYVQLRKIGKLKSLVLGRYRLNLGMGLVINNDFGLGKTATLVSLGQSPNQIRPHSSRTEGNYLQGIATSIRLSNHVDLASFISYRHVDATLNADSTIASIVETGYHRTISEMNKKHNATEGLIGSHINYRNKSFRIGMTGIYHAFNKEINPKTSQIYRQFYPSGKHFWNISTDYGIKTKHLNLHGETATGGCKALATINSLSWQPSNNMTFIAVQRFYSYKYHAIHSQSFSEGGSVQDESGIYVGIDWQPNQRLQLKYYSDFAYFAWPKYQADAPSHAWDHFLSATYQHGSSSFSARYRMKMRVRNNEDKTSLSYQYEHRGRLSFTQTYHAWTVKSQIDLALTRQTTNSFGWMISQNITYRHRQSNINVSIAYFHTDDYNSRIYSYEKQPLYSFSFPMYYGQGIRYSLFFRQDIHPHWMIIAKVGVTNYFDRKEIGTALQTIHHSSQTDLDLQFRWKF